MAARSIGGGQKEGKVFFFEKKNQKTFVCLQSFHLTSRAAASDPKK
jgi:hypothetical protein